MLSFSSVPEAYRPDPPSPAGVNFFLTKAIVLRMFLSRFAKPEHKDEEALEENSFLIEYPDALN